MKSVFLTIVLSWSDIRHLSSIEMYEDSAEELSKLYDDLFWNYRYLYDYGYALHKLGRYEESNVVMNEGAEISSDPMFHNIIGKNYIELCEYDEAEREFKKAHYMVPGRLYPLILLMEMYYSQGKESDVIKNFSYEEKTSTCSRSSARGCSGFSFRLRE